MNLNSAAILFFPLFEKIANAIISLDATAESQFAKFAGESLRIRCKKPLLTFDVIFKNAQIYFSEAKDILPTATISGEGSDLVSMVISPKQSLAGTSIKIDGDVELVSGIRKCLDRLEPDWEDLILKTLGPLAGGALVRMLTAQREWLEENTTKAQRFSSDYITEELRLLPGVNEFDVFASEVDELRASYDRLERRIDQLTESIKQD